MKNTFSSSVQIRLLIKILLLLSGNVHLNPGPFAFMRSIGVSNSNVNVNVPLNEHYSSVKVQFSMIAGSGVQTPLTITSSISNLYLSFNPFNSGSTFDTVPMEIGPLSSPFSFTFSSNATYNILISISAYNSSVSGGVQDVKVINSSTQPVPTLPQLNSNVPVSIINPSVLPVQIENIDPIEVSLEIGDTLPVSIINPSIFPVQIENSDPIHVTIPTDNPLPITGEVSIANPIPSITTSLFNSFRK